MDGVGFPYQTPTWYWYIVEGEDKALLYVEEGDVGADVIIFSYCFFCHSPSYFLFYFYIIILLKEQEFTLSILQILWKYHFINNRFHNLSPAGILVNISLCK